MVNSLAAGNTHRRFESQVQSNPFLHEKNGVLFRPRLLLYLSTLGGSLWPDCLPRKRIMSKQVSRYLSNDRRTMRSQSLNWLRAIHHILSRFFSTDEIRKRGTCLVERVFAVVENAKEAFHSLLVRLAEQGGMTKTAYIRYLSFQHHLTKGVQRHFFTIAAHPSLAGRRQFRDFLYRFALEEEPHFDVARHDLEAMGESPSPCPLDVRLWWAYFDHVVLTRPFVRLGATCVLENLGAGAGQLGHRLLEEAPFLNEKNTRFLQIHFHEELPHGEQIYAALLAANPDEQEILDLMEGARTGAVLYLRMARWAMELTGAENESDLHSSSPEMNQNLVA